MRLRNNFHFHFHFHFQMADITVKELNERLAHKATDEFIFIDVREPHEFAEFNLGAQLIPLGTIPTAATEILDAHKDDEIIIHCRSGARSGQAQAYLTSVGFKNVRNVIGGALAWQEAFPKV